MGKKREKSEAVEPEAPSEMQEAEPNEVPQGDIRPTVDPPEEDSREEQAQKVELEAGMVRIQINTAVNGHLKGDKLTVERDHPFYSALLSQNLAEVVD